MRRRGGGGAPAERLRGRGGARDGAREEPPEGDASSKPNKGGSRGVERARAAEAARAAGRAASFDRGAPAVSEGEDGGDWGEGRGEEPRPRRGRGREFLGAAAGWMDGGARRVKERPREEAGAERSP